MVKRKEISSNKKYITFGSIGMTLMGLIFLGLFNFYMVGLFFLFVGMLGLVSYFKRDETIVSYNQEETDEGGKEKQTREDLDHMDVDKGTLMR